MRIEFPAFVLRSTFTKGADVFVLDYRGSLEVELMYEGAGSQLFLFADPTTAAFFRADLERELLQEGWSLYLPAERFGRSDHARARTHASC